jgi:integrase
MRVRLKGLNSVTKRLADGRTVSYYYAWKGGPPLRGEPGTPEFVASYNDAVAKKVAPPDGALFKLLQDYQASDNFRSRRDRTRHDYIQQIKRIERDLGDFPLAALTDRRTRGVFMEWRDKLALSSRRQADYAWQVLALVLAWAKERGKITVNPCERGGRLYRGNRVDKIWTDHDEAAFLRTAPAHLRLPLLLALWTGQRQGDLLRLTWSAYDGSHIRLRQSKTGMPVRVKVGTPLKAVLDATPKVSPLILISTTNKPWTGGGFRASWRIAQAAAGVVGITFHDLRGTAVTRLALVGCTEAEIAAITGHSLRDVRSILDAHYLHRDPALADAAITKLEGRTKNVD